jgi:hypothetical protein
MKKSPCTDKPPIIREARPSEGNFGFGISDFRNNVRGSTFRVITAFKTDIPDSSNPKSEIPIPKSAFCTRLRLAAKQKGGFPSLGTRPAVLPASEKPGFAVPPRLSVAIADARIPQSASGVGSHRAPLRSNSSAITCAWGDGRV